ncbi:glycerophosphodiester phosphodiesterase [Phytoactinopolyspora mesophila]|uniref:Glycerophosphodiester phosphodiesterase n=1 Tax=Phytoactinopolyspora mesophila TaxID=2650750 RepID=A0A7K3M578_9ACTN|nr:glycerophosphodiester phosphodiesterase [Phytoactinopolyspora mesophila]NDL58396.1 glycerophosphodiester phosphodiesterase [Phytoactinopolyspora mesophila]
MTTSGDPRHSEGAPALLTIAHRAANDANILREAIDSGIDLVEADVRFFKGVPEIRHTKTLGPRLLWEPGELVRRRDTVVPTLADLLVSLGDDSQRLMLDLKGLRPGLAPAVAKVLQEHAPGVPLAISTPHWWMFKAFHDLPHIRPMLSAGSWPMVERLRELIRKDPSTWPTAQPVFACSIHRTLLTPDIVSEVRRRIDHVVTWPVDTPEELGQARELGVTGVTSKDLNLLKSLTTNGRA